MKKYYRVAGTNFTRSTATHSYAWATVTFDRATGQPTSAESFRAERAGAEGEAARLTRACPHTAVRSYFGVLPVEEITAAEFRALAKAAKEERAGLR